MNMFPTDRIYAYDRFLSSMYCHSALYRLSTRF